MTAVAHIDIDNRKVLYRDFIIQELYFEGKSNGWDMVHKDAHYPVWHQFLFECIDAIDVWHMEDIPMENPLETLAAEKAALLEALEKAEQQLDYGQIDTAHRIIAEALEKSKA